MIMIHSRISSVVFKSLFSLGVISLCLAAHSQMVQIPTVSLAMGVPSSTYNGATASGTVGCSNAWTSPGSGTGNNCSPLLATLTKPQAIATDSLGNIYIGEYSSNSIRVIYQSGSALATALKNANPNNTFTPTAGTVYAFGNGNITPLTVGAACGNGTVLDTAGDGCPARYAAFEPRAGIAVDSAGNIFFVSQYPSTINSGIPNIRVIYVGGTTVANMIKAYNTSITTVTPGYLYNLSSLGGTGDLDFINPYDIAIDSNENIYVSDTGSKTTESGLVSSTAGNQIKRFVCSVCSITNATPGWQTYIATTGNTVGVADGDGGVATSASVLTPVGLVFDANNNLYIADVGNDRVRVVYNTAGSKVLPTYVQGSNSNAFVTPVAGNIYSVEGTTNTTASFPSGSLASTFNKTSIGAIGLDPAGNLLLSLSASGTPSEIYRVNASTGIATMLTGAAASATYGVVNNLTSPATGSYCNNNSTGPVMTDAYGDGCPATETTPLLTIIQPHLVFDLQGNFYVVDDRGTGFNPVGVVRKYSFTNQFGTVATGSSSTLSLAFVPSPKQTYSPSPTISLSSTGNSTTEFTDAGGDVCSADATSGYQTCVYYVKFAPALAGARLSSLALSSSGTPIASALLGGVGSGSQISIDPATQSTIGSGLAPAGTAVDEGGNFYISDATSNKVYKSTAGAAPVSFATGFSSPKQIAIDGGGTVYVADSGNSRIAAVTQAGVVSGLLSGSFTLTAGSTATTLSNPSGVAVDKAGDVFIADTGNNRVLEVTGSGGTLPAGEILALGFSGLSSPKGLAVDAAGNVFVADSGNARVVKLTVAGVQSSVSVSPALVTPVGVSVDAAGDLYVADSGNQNVVLVPYGTTTATALLGSTTGLTGLSVDNAGDVIVSASGAGGLLALNRTGNTYAYPSTSTGSTAGPTILTLNNTGNVNLTTGSALASGTDTTDFSIASGSTNGCTTNTVLASGLTAGQTCTLAATFQPQTVGALTDIVTFPTSNAVNSAYVTLSGTGNGTLTAQTITFSPPPSPVTYGVSPITLYATATSGLPVSFTIVSGPGSVGGANGSTLTITGTGTIVIAANQAGNSTYAAAPQVTQSIVVTLASQAGNIWVINSNGTAAEFSSTGNPVSSSSGYLGGGSGIAIDSSGNVWSGTASGTSVAEFDHTGTLLGTFTGAGISSPVSLAVSGAGSIWIANANSTLSQLNSSGAAISPSAGFSGGGLNSPTAIAIDSSGNVWVANSGDSSLTEFFGAAEPVVTSLATSVANGTLGTRP